jgi:GH24 family phage-related lysozyme (muramidase)
MRHITQDGIDLIKRFEGFSSTVYICPAGYPTIGYGTSGHQPIPIALAGLALHYEPGD